MDITAMSALLLHYKYALLIPLGFLEGPIIAMICGVLIHLGSLSLVPAFSILYCVDLAGDTMWYWLGRLRGQWFIHRFGRYVSLTEERVDTVMKIFRKYHVGILFFSKL